MVRYRADPALRWLEQGAERLREEAADSARAAADGASFQAESVRSTLKSAMRSAASFGKGVAAEAAHRRTSTVEYVLDAERFDVVRGGSIQSVAYTTIRSVEWHGERALLRLANGELTIRPLAHLVAPGSKVPLGWIRNGLDAPFATVVEEIAARAGLTPVRV